MGGDPRIIMSPLHPRASPRGNGALGPPSRKDQELRQVCRQIAELAPQKFTSVREAFRYLRADHNGRVSRSQVLYFFRAYGVQSSQANRLFEYFERSGDDDIDCQEFIEAFRPHIAADDEPGIEVGSESAPGSFASPSNSSSMEPLVAKIANEFHYTLEEIRVKAPQKFSHVREALRIVDTDYDGCITQREMRDFFRTFAIDEAVADRFFNRLAKGGPGGANYHTFVQIVAPFLDLPGVAAHSQPPSRPQSAGSRPPSADRHRRQLVEPGAGNGQDHPADILILEGALSARGSPCLPALALSGAGPSLESPSSARRSNSHQRMQSPRAGSERLCTPRSTRGSRNELGEGSRASSPSARGHPCAGSAPCQQAQALPALEIESAAPMDHRAHQLVLGNFGDQEVFKPMVPPPSAGRHGRRPMGIQPEAPPLAGRPGRRPSGIQREVPAVQHVAVNGVADLGQLKPEMATPLKNVGNGALMSGGRPIASPMRSLGRRSQAEC